MREYCQQHPEERASAWCLRYNRSYCARDFEEPGRVECLSPGPFCKFRSNCLVWENLTEEQRRKKLKETRQEFAAEAQARE